MSIHSYILISTLSICFFFLYPILTQGTNEKLVYEDGYSVITVFDGDKSNIKVNPHSIHPHLNDRFILLDSVSSSFYTLSLSTTSNETALEKLVGNVDSNYYYMDGDLDSARFNKPRSFAVDYKGNVYVADHRNHAIRIITTSGVTTIAGGRSQKPGRADGLGSDATFSDDFELTFVPGRCALMVSDHGNRLIRQINLKPENCKVASGSGVLGTSSAWILGLAVSCIIGLVIGLVMRPYIIPYDGQKHLQFNGTWKHYLMNLERHIMMSCSGIRNAVVKSKAYVLSYRVVIVSLSHLSLMFKLRNVEVSTPPKQSVSLLDCDIADSNDILIPSKIYDDLKGLITFDGGPILLETSKKVVEKEERENAHISRGMLSNVDSMIQANLIDFEEQSARVCSTESIECTSGLLKRRKGVVSFPSSA